MSRRLAQLDLLAIREKRQEKTEAARGDRRNENTTDRKHNGFEDSLLLSGA